MANAALPFGMDRFPPRLDVQDPYFSLHVVILFVRDQERSLRFYVDQLGFHVIADQQLKNGGRWIEVAPPDGSASLALFPAIPGTWAEDLLGRDTQIYFITEDVQAKYQELCRRGVHFKFSPHQPEWGGIYTRFEDLDGNSFGLIGFDELTHGVETQRRALTYKRELERRATQELEIAKQVQARLFPQIHPELKTLEYTGVCIQAREVGGDYFDFLDLGQGKLGLVVGDVSGKGIAAALLMANLQANLRSQCTGAVGDPEALLRSVNRLFYENTIDSSYASLVFAEYDDRARRLRYTNCGHLSGLLQKGKSIQRLASTTTLLGLFPDWDCSMQECELNPGDTLVLYTDGLTETCNAAGEEFGEDRLAEALQYHSQSCSELMSAILKEVKHFSSGEQHDDITLIVAKCRTA